MKTIDEVTRKRLIKQAHKHLDVVERELKYIFSAIKSKQMVQRAA